MPRFDAFPSSWSSELTSDSPSTSPGKNSLTQRMTRSAPPAAAPPVQRHIDPAAAAVQRRQQDHDTAAAMGFLGGPADSIEDSISAHAAAGVSGAGQPLPHLDAIQRSFGAHDVSAVRAHVGGAAADASNAIGAHAYATGDDVAFASQPDLFLAAHEAAHVVQQRQGVHLKGKVGQDGDTYERHADEVASAVVRGEDVSAMLGGVSHGTGTAVQRNEKSDGGGFLGTLGGLFAGGKASEPKKSELVGNVRGVGELHKNAWTQLTGEGESAIDILMQFAQPPEKEGITAKAAEHLQTGDEEAFTIAGGERRKPVWRDKQTLAWEVSAARPGRAKLSFQVYDQGELIEDAWFGLIRFAHISEMTDAGLGAAVNEAADRAGEHLDYWLIETSKHYRNAMAKAAGILDETEKWESFLHDGMSTVFGFVTGGIVGGFVEAGTKTLDGFRKGMTAKIYESLASTAVAAGEKGARGATADFDKGDASDAFGNFLENAQKSVGMKQAVTKCARTLMESLTQSGDYKSNDPLVLFEQRIGILGLPWRVASEDEFARVFWKIWTTTNTVEDFWTGWDRRKITAECDRLGVAYKFGSLYDNEAQEERDRKAFDVRLVDEKVHDAAYEAAAKTSDAKLKKRYQETGEMPSYADNEDAPTRPTP